MKNKALATLACTVCLAVSVMLFFTFDLNVEGSTEWENVTDESYNITEDFAGTSDNVSDNDVNDVYENNEIINGEEYYSELEGIFPDLIRDKVGTVSPENAGEIIGIKSILSDIADQIKGSGGKILNFFLTLLGLTIVASVGGMIKGNIASQQLGGAIDSGMSAVFAMAVFGIIAGKANECAEILSELKNFNTALTPIVFAINCAGGNVAGASCGAVSMSVSGLLIGVVCADLLLPLTGAVFVFSLSSSIAQDVNTASVSKIIKNTYMWLLGLVSFLINVTFSFQSILAASADTVAMRSVKYAAGMLPLVGGTVAGSLSALSSGISLIKNTVGISAVVAVWLLFLPVTFELIMARVSFSLCGSAASLLGDSATERMLTSFRGVLDMLIATLVICQVMTIVNIAVFMRSAVAI